MLALALVACGPPEGEPGGAPDDDGDVLEGVFGGDAQLEGGCAWLESGGRRHEVLWPDGYRVEMDPVRLVGPGGDVVAEEGQVVRVRGREAPDAVTICMVGPVFEAETVLTP